MDIKEYYLTLEGKKKSQFIRRVTEKCDISYPGFMYKIREDKWSKLEREAVKEIIKKNGSTSD